MKGGDFHLVHQSAGCSQDEEREFSLIFLRFDIEFDVSNSGRLLKPGKITVMRMVNPRSGYRNQVLDLQHPAPPEGQLASPVIFQDAACNVRGRSSEELVLVSVQEKW